MARFDVNNPIVQAAVIGAAAQMAIHTIKDVTPAVIATLASELSGQLSPPAGPSPTIERRGDTGGHDKDVE